MFLLDTNVVINFLDYSFPTEIMNSLRDIVDEQSSISVITKMEALGFNFKTQEEQHIVETFIDGTNLIEIGVDIVDKTIAIRKTKKITLPDATIAATAITRHLTLITSNVRDFNNIPDLQVIDPNNLS